MRWVYDDGGRAAAGYRGSASDCVTRAVSIAAGLPYREVYRRLAEGNATQSDVFGRRKARSARNGIATTSRWFRQYMADLGATWTPTMAVGSGTTVHLADGELPPGRLVVRVTRHVCAVIDGVVHDTHNPTRGGTRCVYGYWSFPTDSR